VSTPVSETRRFAADQSVSVSRFARLRDQVTAKTGVTQTGWTLVLLSILCWIVARVVGGRPLYLGAYLMLGMFLLSMAIGRRPLPLEGSRSDARPRLAEGETIGMQVSLQAKRRLSTFILEEEIPEVLGPPARVPIATMEGGDSIDHEYKLTLARRGAYELGPLRAKWGDPFGFTQRQLTLQEPFEVLVHPSVEPVQDRPLTRLFEDPPIRPPVSKPWPSGMEFYGMREYTPGDDLRRIVWRAFARTGRLLVRESEQGITDKITIILDTDKRSHSWGAGGPLSGRHSAISESFEAGIRAAASLGVRHLREGYSLTLERNAQRALPPLRGGNSQMRYLDELARLQPDDTRLVDAIMRMISNPQRDTHIVVITPKLDNEAASRLRLLLDRGTSILVAALVWDIENEETLGTAASLGCQVVEVRPNVPLAVSFRREVGAGRL
jgi:uncharacterized protein (DUF58 family)